MPSVGRNDPCPCGSGKKHKKCCGASNSGTNNNDTHLQNKLQQYRATASQLQHGWISSPVTQGAEQHALVETGQRQLEAAVNIYRKIKALDHQDASSLYELGRLLRILNIVHSEGLTESIQCLRAAVELQPKKQNYQIELASALYKNFDMQAVLESTKNALRQFPDNTSLLVMQGNAFIQLHRHSEAKQVLERANQLSPLELDITEALANVYRELSQVSDSRNILLQQAEKEKDNSDGLAKIYYALGFIEDKEKNYQQAYDHFETAGSYQLKTTQCQGWSPAPGLNTISQFTQRLGKPITPLNLDTQTQPSNDQNTQLVFFVGFPRSGTTLTEQVLAAHSQINTSEERVDLGNAINAVFNKHKKNYNDDALALFEQCDDEDYALIRDHYWKNIDKTTNLKDNIYIDKLPLNINHLAWVQAVFPDAKLIVALRDPRDVCLSCFFQHFSPNVAMNHFLTWETTTQYYRHVMSQWLQAQKTLAMDWIELRYEDTVTDLEQQTKMLLNFLALEWEPEMMNYRDTLKTRVVATPSNTAIRQPLNRNAIARWKNYPKACELARKDLETLLVDLGYQW